MAQWDHLMLQHVKGLLESLASEGQIEFVFQDVTNDNTIQHGDTLVPDADVQLTAIHMEPDGKPILKVRVKLL